jgi:HPr kinase/phosphorylase
MNEMPATLKSRVLVHAAAVKLAGATRPFGGYTDGAVLLLGPSGAGKSDVALRLISAGAELISDDQTMLFIEQGILFADAPAGIKGTMEIRGVGILRMKSTGKTPVILTVQLDETAAVSRLPEPSTYALPAGVQGGVSPPLLTFNPFEASTPAKIAAAAAALITEGAVAGALTPS